MASSTRAVFSDGIISLTLVEAEENGAYYWQLRDENDVVASVERYITEYPPRIYLMPRFIVLGLGLSASAVFRPSSRAGALQLDYEIHSAFDHDGHLVVVTECGVEVYSSELEKLGSDDIGEVIVHAELRDGVVSVRDFYDRVVHWEVASLYQADGDGS